jgi:hypothetical protein
LSGFVEGSGRSWERRVSKARANENGARVWYDEVLLSHPAGELLQRSLERCWLWPASAIAVLPGHAP